MSTEFTRPAGIIPFPITVKTHTTNGTDISNRPGLGSRMLLLSHFRFAVCGREGPHPFEVQAHLPYSIHEFHVEFCFISSPEGSIWEDS